MKSFSIPILIPVEQIGAALALQQRVARLEALDADVETVLINHFPLEEKHAVLPRAPRFTPWCGTKLTSLWHKRFRAHAVVFGHLHIFVCWLDGVPFQVVSLGYQSQWQKCSIGTYLREVQLSARSYHG